MTAPTPIEYLLGERPLTVRRRVKWGECDPAGVVYTATFADYVISAAELFYGALFGTTPQRAKHELGFGTPSRALSFDFLSSLRPDDTFDMTVYVADVRTRTYVLDIVATTPHGEPVFNARLTPVCIARDERRSIEVPPSFRQALLDYQRDCGASPVTQDAMR
ncbi:putative thioesterase [Burkholderia aenigmatica]|uniref:Thioesterase n=2 Tax=Burkholderia cepacia complex TaxID=87882 RepID=A0A6J5IZF7_9BURK|nr:MULTISPECIES: thioesterase family protein [Burkholderia]AYQ39600.1 thioesterase [Burkholderia lata]KAF1037113.1 MAG: 4-hydroxybenzoyl-CoA thioesterase [Burkholderia lata]CAB3964563.1 putative thioesterase [Burkholderia aenigmatica]VWC47686.1 putative thioesterase [Burkholderia aenigmatica]VWC53040.1 putative thioesterase [Burkholderia aenigmatica]